MTKVCPECMHPLVNLDYCRACDPFGPPDEATLRHRVLQAAIAYHRRQRYAPEQLDRAVAAYLEESDAR